MASNWSGNISFGESAYFEPRSIDELQELVSRHQKIRVRGSAHSFNSIADTNSIAINLAHLPKTFKIDRDRKVLEVSASLKYGEFIPALHQQGWALSNLASLPHISVGGSVATATHGSGIANQNLASQVSAIHYIDGAGKLHSVSSDDAQFKGLVVGLGLTGIVTSYELKIEPTFNIRQVIYENVSDRELQEAFDHIMGSAYSVSYFTDWSASNLGNLWCKFKDIEEIPDQIAHALPAQKKLHPISGIDPVAATEQFGEVGPWLDRLPHFKLDFTPSVGDEIQSEFFVARNRAPEVIALFRELAPSFNDMLWISELRTIAADDLWMSTAFQRDSVGFHFTWKKSNFDPEVVRNIENHLTPFNYRPHWGKMFYADSQYLSSVYPMMKKFLALTAEIDPRGKFTNAFTDTLIAGKLTTQGDVA